MQVYIMRRSRAGDERIATFVHATSLPHSMAGSMHG
jgi:hypothetical protein